MCSNPEELRAQRREQLLKTAREAAHDQRRIWEFAECLEEIDREKHYRDAGYASLEALGASEFSFGRRSRKSRQLVNVIRRIRRIGVPSSQLPADWTKVALVLPKIDAGNWREWLDKARDLSTGQLRKLVGNPQKPVSPRSIRPATGVPDIRANGHKGHNGHDWRISPPPPDEFYVDVEVWDQGVRAARRGENVLIKGPSGSGKSEYAYVLAGALHLPLHVFNFGDMSEPRSVLLGNSNFNPRDGVTFDKSRFIAAVESGRCIILADEMNRAKPDALNILFTLMDGQGFVALEQCSQSPIIRRGPGVCFVATANDGPGFVGTERICAAMEQRFQSVIEMTFPPPDDEVRVLLARCPKCPAAVVKALQRVAQEQRRLEDVFVHPISTRMLINACEQVADGISAEAAFRFAILNKYSSDGGELSERQQLAKIFKRFMT